MAYLTAISGGIGSGKSVVSRILSVMGFDVYDSDSRAKNLMDNSLEIKKALAETFGPDILTFQGEIDRKRLADIVFNDSEALKRLNSIVHRAVLDDIVKWRENSGGKHLFVETAILYQSGMDRLVDNVWEVTAPEDIRIERIVKRNGITPEEAERRIESQRITVENPHPQVYTIENWGNIPLLPQIKTLLAKG